MAERIVWADDVEICPKPRAGRRRQAPRPALGHRRADVDGAGHGLEPSDWQTLAAAIAGHTTQS
jgi:hypothetical protein